MARLPSAADGRLTGRQSLLWVLAAPSLRPALLIVAAAAILLGSHAIAGLRSNREGPQPLTDPGRLRPGDLASLPAPTTGIRFFEARLEQAPEDAVSLTLLGQLHLQQARLTGDLTSYEQAEQALRQALGLLPGYLPAYSGLAAVRFAQHDFGGALELAGPLVQSNPRRTDLLAILADAQLSLGNYEAAALLYEQLYEAAPTPPVLARLAHQAELHGDPREAIVLMQQAAGEALYNKVARQELAWYLVRLAELHFSVGRFREAEGYSQAALRLYPDYIEALANLGNTQAARGDLDGAIVSYAQANAVVAQPDHLAKLGDLYWLQGNYTLAAQQYEAVISSGDPSEVGPPVYRQLAMFYADHDRQLEEGLRLARLDLQLRQDIYAYDTLAWVLYKKGEFAEAAEAIREAMRLGTRDARLYYHAGMIFAGLEDLAQARLLLAEALSINPYFDPIQARVARQTLDRLEQGSSANPPDG